MTHIEQKCENIVVDIIPDMIRNYTDQSIPTDITDDEIDLWLAVLPDLLAFWEARVVEKKQELENAEQTYKVSLAIAYNEAPDALAVKAKENMAHTNKQVISAADKAIQSKYSMQLTQTMYNKVECKAKSIHKIASLRARRLEVGVVAPSIRGNPEARRNPITRPAQPPKDTVKAEFKQELSKELNDEVF